MREREVAAPSPLSALRCPIAVVGPSLPHRRRRSITVAAPSSSGRERRHERHENGDGGKEERQWRGK
ncbi:hypothetical protein RIF29_11913 [Crotalaria pallida]|uniref:Uncharacterized protein n=1 Tax=Crotalaria pallida TaxID=3830 RepID=A0AAN9P196_CROPI